MAKTTTGSAWEAVFFWAATVMFLGFGWATLRALDRQRGKAQAADYTAGQIGRSAAD